MTARARVVLRVPVDGEELIPTYSDSQGNCRGGPLKGIEQHIMVIAFLRLECPKVSATKTPLIFDGLSPAGERVGLLNQQGIHAHQECIGFMNFADNELTRRSSDSYLLFQHNGGAIDWCAAKQNTVAMSSTEAELLALSRTAKEAICHRHFFESRRFDMTKVADSVRQLTDHSDP